ncbi:MAG: hypothetical protein H0V66_09180 [Bdellovibrionales bacterium]|nr:hypothetical protein [Bdellovibrionales bacterium]
MDSSFLTGLHITLGLFACLLLIKMMVQFGLPNHPARFVCYVVGLCVATYFIGLAATDLNLLSPWVWMKWRALPLIAGSLCILFQTIMLVGSFSLMQEKVISRLPLMAALLCFAFFPSQADAFMTCFLILGGLFLIISVKKARYQKRLYFKMLMLFLIHLGLNWINVYAAYVIGQILLLFFIFYVFLFEHTFGIAALVDDFKESLEGDLK